MRKGNETLIFPIFILIPQKDRNSYLNNNNYKYLLTKQKFDLYRILFT